MILNGYYEFYYSGNMDTANSENATDPGELAQSLGFIFLSLLIKTMWLEKTRVKDGGGGRGFSMSSSGHFFKIYLCRLVRLSAESPTHALLFSQLDSIHSKYLVKNRENTAVKNGTIQPKL